ncbi:MAG: DUF1565 domain-containing protein, partial [Candidatus Firestonebacteria bacterium]
MYLKRVFSIFMLLFGVTSVFAENSINILNKEPVILANIDTVGFSLIYEGDDNNNAAATMNYREAGQKEWKPGHPLFEIKRGTKFSHKDGVTDLRTELAGRIFYLKPAKMYDVKVLITDPDGVSGEKERQFRVQARPEPVVENKTGGMFYVSISGNDNNNGSKDSPFLTIHKAAEKLKAGDTVIVCEGIYNIKYPVSIETAGTAEKPIVIRSEV